MAELAAIKKERERKKDFFKGNYAKEEKKLNRKGDDRAHYSFIDAIRGRGASLGYRFGLDNQLDGGRVFDSNVQVTDAFENRNSFKARTALRPSQSLNITLSSSLDFSSSDSLSFSSSFLDFSSSSSLSFLSTMRAHSGGGAPFLMARAICALQ